MRRGWWWMVGWAGLVGTDRPAEACSITIDAPATADGVPAFGVNNQQTRPETLVVPTNIVFHVGYFVYRVSPAQAPSWLGDIHLQTMAGDEVAVTVAVAAVANDVTYVVMPQVTLSPFTTYRLMDRFAVIPCGAADACAEGPLRPFAIYTTSGGPDVAKPVLAPEEVEYSVWRAFRSTDVCLGTICGGYSIDAVAPAAADIDTPENEIRYRYVSGGETRLLVSGRPLAGVNFGCDACASTPNLDPIVITAVDWVGHESEQQIVFTFPTPPSCAQINADLDAGPDAPPPLPDATPSPDAPVPVVSANKDAANCGCVAAGPAALWPGLAAFAVLLRRRRKQVKREAISASDSTNGASGKWATNASAGTCRRGRRNAPRSRGRSRAPDRNRIGKRAASRRGPAVGRGRPAVNREPNMGSFSARQVAAATGKRGVWMTRADDCTMLGRRVKPPENVLCSGVST